MTSRSHVTLAILVLVASAAAASYSVASFTKRAGMTAAPARTIAVAASTGAPDPTAWQQDRDKVERGIVKHLGAGHEVTCPEPTGSADEVLFCTAVSPDNGLRYPVRVTRTPGEAAMQLQIGITSDLGRELTNSLGASYAGGDAVITCPEFVPIEQGRSFTCTVRLADGTREPLEINQPGAHGEIELASDAG